MSTVKLAPATPPNSIAEGMLQEHQPGQHTGRLPEPVQAVERQQRNRRRGVAHRVDVGERPAVGAEAHGNGRINARQREEYVVGGLQDAVEGDVLAELLEAGGERERTPLLRAHLSRDVDPATQRGEPLSSWGW